MTFPCAIDTRLTGRDPAMSTRRSTPGGPSGSVAKDSVKLSSIGTAGAYGSSGVATGASEVAGQWHPRPTLQTGPVLCLVAKRR